MPLQFFPKGFLLLPYFKLPFRTLAVSISLFLLVSIPSITSAQVDLNFYLPQNQNYNTSIPKPNSVLGFEVGEWHVRHDQLVHYMQTLAVASDRIQIREYGKTHELRPQLVLIVTSPLNHSKLDRLQKEHNALLSGDKAKEYDFENMPGVVWLGYSIHGNEPSGSNASLLVAYHLAASQSKDVEKLLNENIILIEPSLNPDGLNRFANWVNMHRSKNLIADKNSREHLERWPSGRTNHYWFDLNRDWLPLQQPESKNRIKLFHEWTPNLLTDHHEMGTNSTFFFQPGVPSRIHPLIPQKNYELTSKMAQYHARALDEIGALYYTRQNFDDYYFGKGSTYPDINGGVGILFEQASSRGHVQESDNGLLSFPTTIQHQFTVSLSSLQAAKDMRVELLQHMRQFYIDALEASKKDEAKAYIFGSRVDPALNFHFLDMLKAHDIEIYELEEDATVGEFEFKKESAWVVPTRQAAYGVISAVFQRNTVFTDSLFYDISAWTMPLAFNIPHAEIRSKSKADELQGKKIDKLALPSAKIIGDSSQYAYAFEWNDYYAPKVLNLLLQAGVNARVAMRPFDSQVLGSVKNFAVGTILIPVALQPMQPGELTSLLQKLSRENAVQVFALKSGLSSAGIDLGSPSFQVLRKPKVLLLVGEGVSSYDAGEIWHLLDFRFDLPVTLIDVENFSQVKLHEYNTLILANGNYVNLDSNLVQKVEQWVSDGNTLVAVRGAVNWLMKNNIVITQTKKMQSPGIVNPDNRRAYGLQGNDRGARTIGGAICAVKLDLSHPICYGYSYDEMSVFRRGTLFMKAAKNPYSTPVVYAENPLQSGYISNENLELLKDTAVIVTEKHGNGRIVLFADNPNFRGFWFGTNKLFLNSLFFAQAIQ
ncbi:MAG: zinc carboxypeptidase [Deferribacteres bacterium]|nr:zinc carboxypeptidase [candidate division KSB1 bacterium]MCB9500991.1 zinc carboxypeptidase [Deferribacteres bacterium]